MTQVSSKVLGHCPESVLFIVLAFSMVFLKRAPEVLLCSIQADDLGQTCFYQISFSLMTWDALILAY